MLKINRKIEEEFKKYSATFNDFSKIYEKTKIKLIEIIHFEINEFYELYKKSIIACIELTKENKQMISKECEKEKNIYFLIEKKKNILEEKKFFIYKKNLRNKKDFNEIFSIAKANVEEIFLNLLKNKRNEKLKEIFENFKKEISIKINEEFEGINKFVWKNIEDDFKVKIRYFNEKYYYILIDFKSSEEEIHFIMNSLRKDIEEHYLNEIRAKKLLYFIFIIPFYFIF